MNWIDKVVIRRLKRKMREHGYSEMVINRVISYYTRPKPYETTLKYDEEILGQ